MVAFIVLCAIVLVKTGLACTPLEILGEKNYHFMSAAEFVELGLNSCKCSGW
jgi:hypothetical protein